MSSTLTIKDFILKFINNCPIVSSTRLDKTIKALINNYNSRNLIEEVEYLNKIRVIYYFKRLDYRYPSISKKYKGKYFSILE